MTQTKHCYFYEWDEVDFILPANYKLDENSDLGDALNVFYLVGGYDFFNVIDPKYYASHWLDYVGELYRRIVDREFTNSLKHYHVPLTSKQKEELAKRGVPSIFLTDI